MTMNWGICQQTYPIRNVTRNSSGRRRDVGHRKLVQNKEPKNIFFWAKEYLNGINEDEIIMVLNFSKKKKKSND